MPSGGTDRPPWEEWADAVLAGLAGDPRDGDPARTLAAARARLYRSLEEPSLFTAVALMARLDRRDAEVFALLLAIETDLDRQRLVAAGHGDPAWTRLTLSRGLRHPGPPGLRGRRVRRALLTSRASIYDGLAGSGTSRAA